MQLCQRRLTAWVQREGQLVFKLGGEWQCAGKKWKTRRTCRAAAREHEGELAARKGCCEAKSSFGSECRGGATYRGEGGRIECRALKKDCMSKILWICDRGLRNRMEVPKGVKWTRIRDRRPLANQRGNTRHCF